MYESGYIEVYRISYIAVYGCVMCRLLDAAKGEVVVQDCDDDGETAAGSRLLHLLQVSSSTDI